MTTRRNWVFVAIGALLLAACGSSGGSDTTALSTPAPDTIAEPTTPATDPPTSTATPTSIEAADSGVVTRFDEVQPAVVQIIATGTIRDPEVGMATQAGSGSGFIISEDGLAVTNNHVVTGAATLEVYIGGDTQHSYNAQVVGVSECNDLALIQIDTRNPLPTLAWQQTEPSVGQEVYAAGFPLGDPEFTLTRGIVAKAQASGETPWASIDFTIEHDANIQPGNSGGPLVSADGQVVAVNYATGSVTNTSQFFAIDSQLAQEVVAELQNGDFESLGINGQVVVDQDSGIAGVWVAGVAPGSPIDRAGVRPGDIVTSLNGLPIGTDGTMKDYCDVLRTSRAGSPIDIEVLRFDTQEILRGQVNGDGPIELAFSFAEQVGDVSSTGTTGTTGYTGYTTLTDDTGTITISVPNEWTDTYTASVTAEDGTTLPFIEASTDIATFEGSYSAPGIIFTVLGPQADLDALLADFAPASGECTTDNGAADYDDGLYAGRYRYWSGCGGTADYVVLAAVPSDGAFTAIIAAQLLSDADWEALDQAFNSFFVITG